MKKQAKGASEKPKYFSRVEGSKRAIKVLSEIGKQAGAEAAKKGRDAGAAEVYSTNDKIYKVYPDGTEEVVATAKEADLESYFVKISDNDAKVRYAAK